MARAFVLSAILMLAVCSLAQEPAARLEAGKQELDRPPPPPPPESGANDSFSFRRSEAYEGMYEVTPAGETQYSLVSEDFLGLVMRNPGVSDDRKLMVLVSYPDMVIGQYNMVMNENYPDASVEYADAFQDVHFDATDGTTAHATVTQDPMVSAYVRVQLVDAEGNAKEFSLSRYAIGQLLRNPNLQNSPDKMLMALNTYPFRLPDEARYNFRNLSKEEIFDLASQGPLMARQEFIKSYDVFVRDAAEAGRTNIAPPRPNIPVPVPPGGGRQGMPGMVPDPQVGPLRSKAARQQEPPPPESEAPSPDMDIPGDIREQAGSGRLSTILLVAIVAVAAVGVGFALGRRKP